MFEDLFTIECVCNMLHVENHEHVHNLLHQALQDLSKVKP